MKANRYHSNTPVLFQDKQLVLLPETLPSVSRVSALAQSPTRLASGCNSSQVSNYATRSLDVKAVPTGQYAVTVLLNGVPTATRKVIINH